MPIRTQLQDLETWLQSATITTPPTSTQVSQFLWVANDSGASSGEIDTIANSNATPATWIWPTWLINIMLQWLAAEIKKIDIGVG